MPKQLRPPSLRQRKVNSFLMERISMILKTGSFSGLTGIVTLTKVDTTPDLREAKVWFTVLAQPLQKALAALNAHIYQIQGQLYERASMRIVPKIKFYADESAEYVAHIDELFNKINDEDRK